MAWAMSCSSIPSGESCELFSILETLFYFRHVLPMLNLVSETSGDRENAFLHCRDVSGCDHAVSIVLCWHLPLKLPFRPSVILWTKHSSSKFHCHGNAAEHQISGTQDLPISLQCYLLHVTS